MLYARPLRTQVGIVGAGPAGLTLALMLERSGIQSVVIESRSRAYVEQRVRAGLLEHNTVALLHELRVGERLAREGLEHRGIYLRHPGSTQHIDMTELTGRGITIYGQQEVVKDLIAARLRNGGALQFEVSTSPSTGSTARSTSSTSRSTGATSRSTSSTSRSTGATSRSTDSTASGLASHTHTTAHRRSSSAT